MVHDFYGSKYANCLAQLAKLQPALKLDSHLNKYAKELSSAVRQLFSFQIALHWLLSIMMLFSSWVKHETQQSHWEVYPGHNVVLFDTLAKEG